MQVINTTFTQNIKLTLPCYFDNVGYTFKPYDFSFKVPSEVNNEKLNTLIKNEIKRMSWEKLKEWVALDRQTQKGTYLHILMPQEYFVNIGQVATYNILKKCNTIEQINKLCIEEEEQERIRSLNSCDFCGLQLEQCSVLCDRHKYP